MAEIYDAKSYNPLSSAGYLLNRVRTETAPYAKVEAEPSMEGRQMIMVLAPK